MINPLRRILKHHKPPFSIKAYVYTVLIAIFLISCSNLTHSKRELPKKLTYTNIEFVNCNSPENLQYLCLSKEDAEISVIDFRRCQEQNSLLRDLLDGS